MCLCVCLHNNVKTMAGICVLFGSYVDRRKNIGRVRMSRSQVKVNVIFQRVEEVYDFLLEVAGL